MIKDKRMNTRLKLLISIALIFAIIYLGNTTGVFGFLYGAVSPLLVGLSLAYVLNILIKKVETIFFPKSNSKYINRLRRPICAAISVVIVICIAFLVVYIVLPQVMNTIFSVRETIPHALAKSRVWFSEIEERYPAIAEQIKDLNIDWDNVGNKIIDFTSKSFGVVFSSMLGFFSSFTSGVINTFISIIFAVYLLVSKEKLLAQLRRFKLAFIREERREKLNHIVSATNESFTHFIAGQCIEAVILGVLCTLGMWIFRFPYAGTIGVFVGVTAIIPIVGAYLGACVGAFLIVMISPIKAILFVVYIIVLQQLEGNIIYPRVVGSSVGLPGIWVFIAIIIGGGLGGILGMLLGVPIMATVYKLVRAETRKRLDDVDVLN